VNENRCPTEAELLAFADADLSPEQLRRVEVHLEVCRTCSKQVISLSTVLEDLAAAVGPPLDVAEHVASVMKRLDSRGKRSKSAKRAFWGGAAAAATLAVAAAALLALTRGFGSDVPRGQLAARGEAAEHGLAREVGVQVYEQAAALRALNAESHVPVSAALTAGLRNVGGGPAYLLLFAVDARHAVHWVAPEFTVPGSDPAAVSISPSLEERLLPSAVAFDDLAPGPSRIVALVSKEPMHVSEIEALTSAELSQAGLAKRFPRAEVRQFVLEVTP
jgi:hypothetical protein